MIDKNTIEKRIAILDEDIVKVKQNLQNLEQQKIETIGMINALNGAKQQCQSFLKEFNNDEPEASDSSDVE
jgi:prephenate dehydratase|tara:strand:+ start:243 stop:455 length:213 start_codon:yes stop_codon:yes gene_type:complete